MKRTGKSALILFLFSVLGAYGSMAWAQTSVKVNASVSETTIYTGERVTLSIEISGDFNNVSRPKLPDFPGLRLLSNNPSTSRSYSFVNGKSSTSYSYSYYLIAQTKGNQTIPAITVNIDGKDYTTDPIRISIVDRNSSADNPSSSQSRPDIFLRMDISDKKPVTGQQLIANVVLYFKDGLEVNSYQPVPGWKAEGFWKEELENSQRPRAESVIIDGVRYRKANLLQFALFPTKAGKLTISPYKIIVSVRSVSDRDDPFSSFFGGFGTNQRQVDLKSDPLTINVKGLPEEHDANYIGAVGSYDISRSISTKQATVGESVEIKTRIKGTGNIPLISKPSYDLPKGLEVYEPQEKSSLNRQNKRISGTKVFTDVVIARKPGSFTIPEAKLAYYNSDQNRYVTKTLPAISFDVQQDPNAVASGPETVTFSIKPITGLATWVTPTTPALLSHWWFWAGLVFPMIILGVGYWQKSYREKMNTDSAFARSKRADNTASERLNKTIRLSEEGHIKEAYNELQKALTGFIGDRLGLPEAGLSLQQYVSALDERGIDPNLVKNVRMLLDKCASISYAPNTSHEYLKSHVGLAQSIMEKLKKEL